MFPSLGAVVRVSRDPSSADDGRCPQFSQGRSYTQGQHGAGSWHPQTPVESDNNNDDDDDD